MRRYLSETFSVIRGIFSVRGICLPSQGCQAQVGALAQVHNPGLHRRLGRTGGLVGLLWHFTHICRPRADAGAFRDPLRSLDLFVPTAAPSQPCVYGSSTVGAADTTPILCKPTRTMAVIDRQSSLGALELPAEEVSGAPRSPACISHPVS
jgi:hypothetical protein